MLFPQNVLTTLLKCYQTFPVDSRSCIASQKCTNKQYKNVPLRLSNSSDTPPHQDCFFSSHTNLNCVVFCCVCRLILPDVSCLFQQKMSLFSGYSDGEGSPKHLSSDTTTMELSSAPLFAVFATRVSAFSLLSHMSICTSQNLLEEA